MTRIYYTDPYCLEFDANVTAATPDESAQRWRVTLDRSAFYPTSGGQPFDIGQLGSARVLDVSDDSGAVDIMTGGRKFRWHDD